MKYVRKLQFAATGIAFILCNTLSAQEITIKGVSAWPEGNQFSTNFEKFIEKVNEDGKGVIQINYLGGGEKVIPTFEVGNAVKSGVVDIVNVAGGFYTNTLPEAEALSVGKTNAQEWRENGTLDYINEIYSQKMNTRYLGRAIGNEPFHLFLKKPITGTDLEGVRLRGIPLYRAFFESLGASVLTIPPGELYTALERGVVDGYGWPVSGLFDRSLHEQTKYRVEPGFYNNEVGVLVNLDTWNKLNDQQKKVLEDAAIWMESLNADNDALWVAEKKRQADAGIEAITFSDEESKRFLDQAYETVWAAIIERSPEHGPKLRELLDQ